MSQKKKILLVDDSQTVLLMHQLLLADRGYELLTARDGQDAVETAMAERPDIIFMDVLMPRVDGFAACQELRAHESTRDIPIIMVTTRSEPQNVQRGFESGCSDYITKPFNVNELLDKLERYLSQ
ncbi:response regulator receiver domain-containing protein [Archangium gephyra]|uniref:Response regulator receiver domain-containing protein n=2 Tax=Archangium gephyra TaxID=48 RepID=A0ABX9K4N9_9BACT|nr:response regulator [Archangium gephyra]REG32896.1 response regulator receiver domain-containing protein [Archangium gephyra]